MNRTRVKICGITRVEDALAAARAGADAIGLVFCKSAARYITTERAREIIAALPPFVTPVGLFVDESSEQVREIARELGLRHIQLHGSEPPDAIRALRQYCVIKAVRAAPETFATELVGWRDQVRRGGLEALRGLVLETDAPAPGGTGVANDWNFIRQCQAQGAFLHLPPIIAAGGLTPQSVGDVIRLLHPWAVDVSSGVESVKGIKSREKIEAFVRAVADTAVQENPG